MRGFNPVMRARESDPHLPVASEGGRLGTDNERTKRAIDHQQERKNK
jgi:hypothetical protein